MEMDLESLAVSFRRNGYVVVPDLLTPEQIKGMCDVSDRLVNEEVPLDGGGKFHDIGRGDARRFLRQRFADHAEIRDVLFCEPVTKLAGALLGRSEIFMFNEQFVIKAANQDAAGAFGWHQDGVYVDADHDPYLTMWVALDEATEANGCLFILPRDLDENSTLSDYEWSDETKERIGYFGSEPGVMVPAKPGTMVVFSSTTLHRSAPNVTGATRRAYLCQYSPSPIINPLTGGPKHFAIPVEAGSAPQQVALASV